MSTTVKYKGNTIATIDNETKRLITKGTWLEDDIEIVDESSGSSDGSSVPPWVTSTETITIGANSITNTEEIGNYFSSYVPFAYAYLKTSPDTNNQCVALYGLASTVMRYRGGSIGSAPYRSNYDGKLVEGTQYEVWRLS